MDALRAAAPLVRLLLALGDAKHDGELWLQRPSGPARISLVEGQIVAIAGVEAEPLGDLLLARGELDPARQRALADGVERIGARLVAAGAASAPAVQQALQRQLVRRLARLLRGPQVAARLAPRLHQDAPSAPWRVSAAAAACGALVSLACGLPEHLLTELATRGSLVITELGLRRLPALERVLVSGELAHVLETLEVKLRLPSLVQVCAAHPQAVLQPLRASLRALGMLTCASERRMQLPDGYGLLLRKRRELRRNASARTLLDLPGSAGPEHARRALRRLARKLHPDRYEACDTRLRALFGETMSALSRAEHALRTAT